MARYRINWTSTLATPLPSHITMGMEATVKIKTILMGFMETRILGRVLIVSRVHLSFTGAHTIAQMMARKLALLSMLSWLT